MKNIIIYMLVINIIAMLSIAFDKSAARNGEERVRESSLMLLAFLGGSPGMLLAMYVFHHKTKKKKFKIGVPLIFLVEAAAVVLVFLKFFL